MPNKKQRLDSEQLEELEQENLKLKQSIEDMQKLLDVSNWTGM